jgi:hypothetical protein
MSLQAFALIIVAGLIHAGWNMAAKKAGRLPLCLFHLHLMMVIWAPLGWWLGRDVVPGWGGPNGRWWSSAACCVAYYVTLRGYRMRT